MNFSGDRAKAVDEFNEDLIRTVNATGEIYLSHTRLNGRLVIRLALGNIRTERRHIERVWEILKSELARLKKNLA